MASYKSQFSTTSTSSGENPLHIRKHVPVVPNPGPSIPHSASRLIKKRHGQSTENARATPAQKENFPRAAGIRNCDRMLFASSIAARSNGTIDGPQAPSMLPTSSSRPGRFDASYSRTPSLVSGSSASTGDSPTSNILRREPSSIGRLAMRVRRGSVEFQEDSSVVDTLNDLSSDPFPDSILGTHMRTASLSLPKENIPEGHSHLFASASIPPPLTTADLTPPNLLYALSATPSTAYSGSPGPFSIASTPTSISSFSPGTMATSRGAPRMRQPSPTRIRPPLTIRTNDGSENGLASVREYSSSGSTIRSSGNTYGKEKLNVELLSPFPQSPLRLAGSSTVRSGTNYEKKAEVTAGAHRPTTAVPPPELAHLLDPMFIQARNSTARPVRPSRDGTPDYFGLREPSPVVHSNLSSLPSSIHRRQSSSESRSTPSSSFSQLSRGMSPENLGDGESRSKKTPPSLSRGNHRFGFFRGKTEPLLSTTARAITPTRKGPAAGTGHEGYGKYSFTRGRRGSIMSGMSNGRSPSVDSGTDGSPRIAPRREGSMGGRGFAEMDGSLPDRLAPVTLRGTGESKSGLSRRPQIERNQSDSPVRRVADARNPPAVAKRLIGIPGLGQPKPLIRPVKTNQPLPSASPVKSDERPSTPAQSLNRFGFKRLGNRQLARLSASMEGIVPSSSPASSDGPSVASMPHLGTSSTRQPSTSAPNGPTHSDVTIRNATQLPALPRPEGKLTRKWNFFQRTRNPAKPDAAIMHQIATDPGVSPHHGERFAAHIAMMGDDLSHMSMEELERIVQEAGESPDERGLGLSEDLNLNPDHGIDSLPHSREDVRGSLSPDSPVEETPRRPHGYSMLLPDKPVLGLELEASHRPISPIVPIRRDSPDSQVLPQKEQTSAFLRTVFDRDVLPDEEPASPLVPLPPQRQRLPQIGRIPYVRCDREAKLSFQSFSRPFGNDGSPATQQQSLYKGSTPEADKVIFETPGVMNRTANQLRLTSFVDEPDAALDLHRLSIQSATTIDPTAMDTTNEFFTFPPRQDSDRSASSRSGNPGFRTTLATAPAISMRTSAQYSHEDEIWSEYDDWIDDILRPATAVRAKPVPPALPLRQPVDHSEPHHIDTDKDDEGSDCSQNDEDETQESFANLRFGALITSKWLSFGRVLFSPAHSELKDSRDDRVLVIDGLGKDWSYYVAISYPTASVYSLGADPSSSSLNNSNASTGPLVAMPNHRHFHHPTMSAPFPFPKGFFAAVIFRFPAAASESVYRAALSECKRVLRLGGYLEISVLDMDPVNMGNKTRNALKSLKMRINEQNPDVCLRPLTDVIMKLVGQRGFEDIQRCVVGVPAAGPVTRSGEFGASPRSRVFEGAAVGALSRSPQSCLSNPSLTFTDLLKEGRDSMQSESSNIYRMVARVGRWWYEKSYESVASMPPDGQTMWKDETLIRECERCGTSFRMLVCYARKPTGAVRWTVSV